MGTLIYDKVSFRPLSNLLVVAMHIAIVLLIIFPLQLLVIFWIFELHIIQPEPYARLYSLGDVVFTSRYDSWWSNMDVSSPAHSSFRKVKFCTAQLRLVAYFSLCPC